MTPDTTIRITSEERISTIRLKDRTKKMLEALGQGKETHEEILLRLIKLANHLTAPTATGIIRRGRVTGTAYGRLNRVFTLERGSHAYSAVCTYNDLAPLHMLKQSGSMRQYLARDGEPPDWEVDLQIVNVREGKGEWQQPDSFGRSHSRDFLLIYLACLRQVLEESFDVKAYELTTEEDLFEPARWEEMYRRNGLSMESYRSDVAEKLKGRG